MLPKKLFIGARIRELRQKRNLTQRAFAEQIDISPSYLNQIENNQRPVSAAVVLALARRFDLDVASLEVDESGRVAADLAEACADPVLAGDAPSQQDLRIIAANSPNFARAFLKLHRAYKQANERLAGIDDALVRGESGLAPLPYEEVRDFFHYLDNYIDPLDRIAERLAEESNAHGASKLGAAQRRLERHGVRVAFRGEDPAVLRHYDRETRTLTLSPLSDEATHAFQLFHQIALLEQGLLMDRILDEARLTTAAAREVCRIGLANYFAGAAVLPYGRFLAAARELRHDLELLANRFRASLEQVAHRLSTLQRPGETGIPFFFVRVDRAGTITKRHSATRLQFARFGGACPLWNVHRAFEQPGVILRQLAETPDGVRYLCLARDLTKHTGGYRAPVGRFAMGLGCEVKYARDLVYADDLDLARDGAYEPIGVSCRICERTQCHQRSVPPVERDIAIDHDHRATVPYRVV